VNNIFISLFLGMSQNRFSGANYFIFGCLFLVTGIIMLVFDISKVGQHYLTQQQTAVGGYFVIFISLVLFGIGYFCLSPFSKVREFLEGTGRKR
jgi:hypothetical protein